MDRCSREGEGWHGLDGSMDPRRWNQWIQVSAERCLRGARAAQIGGSVSIRAVFVNESVRIIAFIMLKCILADPHMHSCASHSSEISHLAHTRARRKSNSTNQRIL